LFGAAVPGLCAWRAAHDNAARPMEGRTMPFIDAGGLRMYYERAGAGPPLLWISGTGGDLRVKPGVFDSPLPGRFDVLAFDQRGLGQTETPPGPYTMQQYADDAAALLDAVGWDRCAVVGVSFGGMVAQELALRHGDRVTRLVLACTSSGGPGGSSYPLHELQDLPPEQRAPIMLELNDTRTLERRQRHPDRYAAVLKAFVDSMHAAPQGQDGARLQLDARRGHDTWARLPSLKMPVCVCGGRFDAIAPPANSGALAARIPGARLDLFDGGHLFLAQDRRAYDSIVAFLLDGTA
jgi:3-oxoadipate enol-lactonase